MSPLDYLRSKQAIFEAFYSSLSYLNNQKNIVVHYKYGDQIDDNKYKLQDRHLLGNYSFSDYFQKHLEH